MNSKTALLFLSLTSATGCVINGGPYNGNVQFTWTFTGLSCSDVPQVASVAITIPGEILQDNGIYPCLTNNYPGIVLHDFLPGTYSFTLQAIDAYRTVLYSASGSFRVDGDVVVPVDLSPTSAAPAFAYLTWSFPPNTLSTNPTCAQARVDVVDVAIDQGPVLRYTCSDGQTQPGVLSTAVSPGTHTITLTASSPDVGHSYPYYRAVSTLTATSATPTASAYPLAWAVGGVSVQWDVSGGTCANVPTINVNFRDASGQLLYGSSGDPQGCLAGLAPTGAIRYDYLPPGTYALTLQGSAGGSLYTNTPYPPVTITPGFFSDSQMVRSTLHP